MNTVLFIFLPESFWVKSSLFIKFSHVKLFVVNLDKATETQFSCNMLYLAIMYLRANQFRHFKFSAVKAFTSVRYHKALYISVEIQKNQSLNQSHAIKVS